MQDRLYTLHEALTESALEPIQRKADDDPMATFTFRIPKAVRAQMDELCERHTTSLPAFLRACCERVLREYR